MSQTKKSACPAVTGGAQQNNQHLNNTAMLDHALAYAARGWHVFPIHEIGKCKAPRTAHGLNDATTDESAIRAWWTQWPNANIGINAGASNLLVLDVDDGGEDSLAGHWRLPDTVESITGGGGRHVLFKRPAGDKYKSCSKFEPGLDSRADGGYIVAPPSIHESGRRYEWEASSEPDDVALADPPGWLVKAVRERAPDCNGAVPGWIPAGLPSYTDDMLAAIPADDFETWRDVGLALHYADPVRGLTLWDAWSQKSAKYDGAAVQREWANFTRRGHRCSNPTTVASIWHAATAEGWQPAALADQSANDPEITPFADPFAIGIGDMLATEPPARRWLLDDLLPLGIVGLLAAGGGTGKSFLTMQMAISVATGRPFLGMAIGEPGGVLMIAAEDEREELHRRLWRIVQRMRNDGDLTESDIDLLRDRLFIAPSVGVDNRLTAEYDRTVIRTQTGERIEALIDQLPPTNLIVLDPVSRFRGGDENGNEAATRFVEAVEALRAKTGATLLLPHHVNKGALTAGSEGLSAEGMRGASALLDGVRWAAAMATLRKDHAELYGIDPEDAGRYVRLDTVKNNYAAPWDGQWLERLSGGVLAPTSLEKQAGGAKQAQKQQQAEDRFHDVASKVQRKVREAQDKGRPLTRRQILEYAGASGVFGVGDQTLRGILKRAIDESYIAAHRPDGERYEVLKTWQ